MTGRRCLPVDARDRGSPGQPDPILASLGESDYRELWLFAVDSGNGLTEQDSGGITRFRRWGGALLHPASAGVCYAANWLPEHAEHRLPTALKSPPITSLNRRSTMRKVFRLLFVAGVGR